MSDQIILSADNNYKDLDSYFIDNRQKVVMLVCDGSLPFLKINTYFESLPQRLGIEVVKFDHFTPNPLYESVVEGVDLFHRSHCDSIIAVGGGSAMDVAKCIKLYSNMDSAKNYLQQTIVPNDIKLLAIPTTAGTGSEATRYAVIYYEGNKQSVADHSCIPATVLFDAGALKTLPEYQKKSTMMDALCHAIESFWSVNSTEESREYSRNAIELLLANKAAYLANEDAANAAMLRAANLAGKAINITQTTAGHAMCYKLTSLYGIAHGHAAALCLAKLFPYMLHHTECCIDPRGEENLIEIFQRIAEAMHCEDAEAATHALQEILAELKLSVPVAAQGDYEVLCSSVNPVRLKNNPVRLDAEAIHLLYHKILEQ